MRSRPLLWLWAAFAVQIAGRLLDARWHATHDEFEGAAQQLEAHWLVWLGAALTTAVAFVAWRLDSDRRTGYALTFAGGVLYAVVAIWHFIEHANRQDPVLAHGLLVLGQITMVVGVILATVQARRAGRARSAPARPPTGRSPSRSA